MRKRLIGLLLAAVLLSGCGGKYSVDYGETALYSREEMVSAVKVITETFFTWEGCRLYEVTFAGDTLCREELEYCRELGDKAYDSCIVFRTRFRSPIRGGGAWNPNTVYDWSWYLAKENGGNWELLTWGAP